VTASPTGWYRHPAATLDLLEGDEELVAEADRLDARAIEAGEESPQGRELRGSASALRVQALGERIYPVLVCRECFAVTGWLSADGFCDSCVRRAQLDAAYSAPHGGWVAVDDMRPPASEPKAPGGSLRSRLASLRHPREAHDRAVVRAWMVHVRPDETGPIEPEQGYEVELAKREELEAADRSGMVIRFHTATAVFGGGDWSERETTRIAHRDILVPPEFPASLPVEQLVEAWGDYQAAVDGFNRRAWAGQSERREAQRQADAAHADALREQRDVVDLLDEG
jgi:hypothetical protein